MKRSLYLGCTEARHEMLGVHAIINARGGELWRNFDNIEEIEMERDARAIRLRISDRVRLYGFVSKFFRRHAARLEHLLSDRRDNL